MGSTADPNVDSAIYFIVYSTADSKADSTVDSVVDSTVESIVGSIADCAVVSVVDSTVPQYPSEPVPSAAQYRVWALGELNVSSLCGGCCSKVGLQRRVPMSSKM